LTPLLVALCAAWSLPVLVGCIGDVEAGALTLRRAWLGEYWRLPASLLVHRMPLHLVLNALSLLFVGSYVERAVGARRTLAVLLVAAGSAFAASFFFTQPSAVDLPREGISGGVAGLVGAIFAIEWAGAGSLRAFVRRYAVQALFVLLAINVLVAIKMPVIGPGVIDNAAHVGGLAGGLLLGLAWFGARGARPLPATLAALLCLAPLGYAIHPWKNPDFQLVRAERLDALGETAAAARAYERVLGSRPEDPFVRARLAALTGDPAHLFGMRPPRGPRDAAALADAVARLRRPPADAAPEERAAFRDALRRAGVWLPARAGWRASAEALEIALALAEPGGESAILDDALQASLGLGEDSGIGEEERGTLEALLTEAATRVALEAQRPIDDAGARRSLRARLARLYERLAYNAAREASVPRLLYLRALWHWRAAEGTGDERAREEIAAMFRAAEAEAARLHDEEVRARAAAWLRGR
jgi:membrane associated rhomboid family serine protease